MDNHPGIRSGRDYALSKEGKVMNPITGSTDPCELSIWENYRDDFGDVLIDQIIFGNIDRYDWVHNYLKKHPQGTGKKPKGGFTNASAGGDYRLSKKSTQSGSGGGSSTDSRISGGQLGQPNSGDQDSPRGTSSPNVSRELEGAAEGATSNTVTGESPAPEGTEISPLALITPSASTYTNCFIIFKKKMFGRNIYKRLNSNPFGRKVNVDLHFQVSTELFRHFCKLLNDIFQIYIEPGSDHDPSIHVPTNVKNMMKVLRLKNMEYWQVAEDKARNTGAGSKSFGATRKKSGPDNSRNTATGDDTESLDERAHKLVVDAICELVDEHLARTPATGSSTNMKLKHQVLGPNIAYFSRKAAGTMWRIYRDGTLRNTPDLATLVKDHLDPARTGAASSSGQSNSYNSDSKPKKLHLAYAFRNNWRMEQFEFDTEELRQVKRPLKP